MEFEQKEHDKLVESVEKIFNYLIENVVPKLHHKINICFSYENGEINLIIYPQDERCCFELTDNSDVHYCIQKLRKHFYDGRYNDGSAYFRLAFGDAAMTPLMFDISTSDGIMYAFLENWEYIKTQCKEAFDKDKEMKQKILSFEIE